MKFLPVSGGLMLVAVALGALGAHALEPRLEASGHQDSWETAVLYHLVHGLALFGLGIWQRVDARVTTARWAKWTGCLWLAGVVGFSGSLYALSLGGPKWLGPVTPLGGLCLLAGWVIVAIGSGRRSGGEPKAG